MDGEERNASLPILGSQEIFPRTDPTGPRNPVVVTEGGLGRVALGHSMSQKCRTRVEERQGRPDGAKSEKSVASTSIPSGRSYGVPCNPRLGVSRSIV